MGKCNLKMMHPISVLPKGRISVFVILFLLFIILSSPNKAKADVVSYKIISDIVNNQVEEEHVILFFNDKNTSVSKFSILFPKNIKIVYVKDEYSSLEYSLESNGFAKMLINLPLPIKPGERRLIFIKISTDERIKKMDGYYEYTLVVVLERNVSEFEHILKLPKGAKLFSPKNFTVLVPNGSISRIDDRVIINWKAKITAHKPKVFLVRFRKNELNLNIIITLALLSLVSATSYKFATKIWRRYKNIKLLKSLEILNERERKVLEEIARNEGIYQYELMEKLGYTKSSLSKILTRLESRGLVKRIKEGKVNRLYLGNKLKGS